MFKKSVLKTKNNLISLNKIFNVNRNNLTTVTNKKWDISAGLYIERLPKVMPELNILEKSLREVFEKIEYQKSYLSDYDYAIKKVKEEKSTEEKYLEKSSKVDYFITEGKLFIPNESKSGDEENKKSLDRLLDKNLVLFTKMKLGENSFWSFPFMKVEDEDSLNDTAKKLLQKIDDPSKFKILGYSPFTYFEYNYPKKLKERMNADGNIIFYFKCQFIDPKTNVNIIDKELFNDYNWLSRNEYSTLVKKKLWTKLKNGLLSEDVGNEVLTSVVKKLKTKKLQTKV